VPNTAPQIHPAHAAAMAAKALRLALFLRSHGAGFEDPDVVAWMSDDQWERITELAGERRIPSAATRAQTVTLLREMPDVADRDLSEIEAF
jgi:hypothetical protein